MTGVFEGFEPFYDSESKVLILGSFPSVMSRAEGFYYGNPQNRFWKTVSAYFGESTPKTVDEKKAFLKRRKIALWDVVTSCEIDGSKDSSIRGEEIADIPALLKKSQIKALLCNGTKSYSALQEHFPDLLPITKKLPSTSPANPRFSAAAWHEALDFIFQED